MNHRRKTHRRTQSIGLRIRNYQIDPLESRTLLSAGTGLQLVFTQQPSNSVAFSKMAPSVVVDKVDLRTRLG